MDGDKNRHDFKNQLGIILGFSEILLAEAAAGDPRRDDFEEIHTAAVAALDLLARLYPTRPRGCDDGEDNSLIQAAARGERPDDGADP